jgi:hypothetical protein
MKRGFPCQLAEAAVTVAVMAVTVAKAAVMAVEAAAVVSVEVGAWVSHLERRSPLTDSCSVCRWPNTPKNP